MSLDDYTIFVFLIATLFYKKGGPYTSPKIIIYQKRYLFQVHRFLFQPLAKADHHVTVAVKVGNFHHWLTTDK